MSQLKLRSTQNFEQYSQDPQYSILKTILNDAGLQLARDNNPNILKKEQALVVRDLEKCLTTDYKTNHDNFVRAFKKLCKKEEFCKKALLPTQLQKSMEENIKVEQDSLFRILLKVSSLQNVVFEILLEKITTNATEEVPDIPLRLLLNQLRYLPYFNMESLSQKLIDIIEISETASQLDILDVLPEIIPDSEYDKAANQLCKLLDENNESLSGGIIDCLNALNLDSTIRNKIQDYILNKISGNSLKIFPVILDFIMTDWKAQNLPPILNKIRNALDNIMTSSNKDKEKESVKIIIFQKLQGHVTAFKLVAEAWITFISSVKEATNQKPIDLLILFMIHNCSKVKKRAIEVFFRKRIKDGLFRCLLLEQLFDKYLSPQLLRDYFTSIVEIGCSLLRSSNEATVTEFASTLFKLLFNNPNTETIYRQQLLDSLILLTGTIESKNITLVLNILLDLVEDLEKTRHHTVLLMRLLEKLDSFSLKDGKLVFQILCQLVCSDESLSGLRDEIHITIRKQLSSWKKTIRYRGIISAVVMAKYIANNSEDHDELAVSESSIVTINQLTGNAKTAALLLELANNSTCNFPDLLGLYYDQISSMLVKSDDLDKNFIIWLYESITSDFQNIFVTETICGPINDLEFSIQYNVNTDEEIHSPLAINIAGLALNPNMISISILAPHFRLLRLLHNMQHNGDLSTIDALLGCGVILPKIDDMDLMTSDQLKQVANCLFYCINWFREVISGFSPQKGKKLRCKVIQRISNLIELEKLLMACLQNIPEHRLPISYFDISIQSGTSKKPGMSSPKKEKPPKKKLKSAEIIADDSMLPSTSRPVKTIKSVPKSIGNVAINFRELDIDVIRLVKYQLKDNNIGSPPPSCSNETFLSVEQLNFILTDFVAKLNLLTTGKDLGLSHLNIVAPLDLIKDCVLIFPNINKHFIAIVVRIKQLREQTNNSNSAPELFTDVVAQLKTCFGLILESILLIFTWSGFQHSKHLELLRDLFRVLYSEDYGTSYSSVNRLSLQLAERLCSYSDYCLDLNHAANLIKILEALDKITPRNEIRKHITDVSEKLLQQRWYNYSGILDSGKISLINIDIIIKSYFKGSTIQSLYSISLVLEQQVSKLKGKNDVLPLMETITKSNFYILYRNLWQTLYERIKIEVESLTNQEHLELWQLTTKIMQHLMHIAKVLETKNLFECFLKKSISILKIFMSHGIPILEIMLRSHPDNVVEIFKTIQLNTRFLHHLCCSTKMRKDSGLITYVPQFRQTLETLVYRVKAAFTGEGCIEAFWMGNLKNRDIDGESINSQATEQSQLNETTETMETEDNEQLSEDENSDDDIFGNNDDDSGESKAESECV